MKLKPFVEETAIDTILKQTGVVKAKSAKVELDQIRAIFDDNGAGIEDVAKMTGGLISHADKEETRLRAGELALKVQGIFRELDEKPIPQITINVVGSENQTLINLVCPT